MIKISISHNHYKRMQNGYLTTPVSAKVHNKKIQIIKQIIYLQHRIQITLNSAIYHNILIKLLKFYIKLLTVNEFNMVNITYIFQIFNNTVYFLNWCINCNLINNFFYRHILFRLVFSNLR